MPAMPSATTADSSDSMAPSMAIVKAGPMRMSSWENDVCGHPNTGKPCGIPPKALPMVATAGKCSVDCTAVATSIARSGPGMALTSAIFGAKITTTKLSNASAKVGRFS